VDRVPNDLPPLAGLVTGEFQTPLAHVNLLSQQRGTPNMALLGAAEDPRFVEQDGRWVELEVRADGFSLAPSNPEAAAAYWEASRPSEPQVPALDLASSALLDATELDARDTARVGGKAANFGELTRVSPALPLPTAFAVPCARYVEFMERAGLTARVDALLADESLASDGRRLQAELAALRAAIEAAPVDPALLAEITDRAHARFGDVPTRLRSSANAEDLADFNGAGLYESATWDPSDPGRPLERALRRVYASLWSFAAFQERDWARVDHRACAMGVLVHPSFPDEIEAANGVAITDNPFDPPPDGQAAYYVNVQSGATPVTNPEPGTLHESFLYYKPPAGQGEMTYFTSSSLTAASGCSRSPRWSSSYAPSAPSTSTSSGSTPRRPRSAWTSSSSSSCPTARSSSSRRAPTASDCSLPRGAGRRPLRAAALGGRPHLALAGRLEIGRAPLGEVGVRRVGRDADVAGATARDGHRRAAGVRYPQQLRLAGDAGAGADVEVLGIHAHGAERRRVRCELHGGAAGLGIAEDAPPRLARDGHREGAIDGQVHAVVQQYHPFGLGRHVGGEDLGGAARLGHPREREGLAGAIHPVEVRRVEADVDRARGGRQRLGLAARLGDAGHGARRLRREVHVGVVEGDDQGGQGRLQVLDGAARVGDAPDSALAVPKYTELASTATDARRPGASVASTSGVPSGSRRRRTAFGSRKPAAA
jgi:hypothetical protein